jgi:predicted ester cyclase
MPTAAEALDAAVASWNRGDLDGYLTLYSDGIRIYGYAPEPMGKAAVRGFYEGTFAAFERPQLDFRRVLWEGTECAVRFTMSGRHTGRFMGVPATGKFVNVPGITILRFEGAQVVERWSQADMLGLLVQIGAAPAPA